MKKIFVALAVLATLGGCATVGPSANQNQAYNMPGGSFVAFRNLVTGNYAGGSGAPKAADVEADLKAVNAVAGPMPDTTEATDLIYKTITKQMKDPDSIKQFAITRGPLFVNTEKWVGLLNGGTKRVIGWLYCAEYNGKNSYGAYGGVEQVAFLLQNASYLNVVTTGRGCS